MFLSTQTKVGNIFENFIGYTLHLYCCLYGSDSAPYLIDGPLAALRWLHGPGVMQPPSNPLDGVVEKS
jgi:hypothetical protein